MPLSTEKGSLSSSHRVRLFFLNIGTTRKGTIRHKLPVTLRLNGSIHDSEVWLPRDSMGSHTLNWSFKTRLAASEVSLPRRFKPPPRTWLLLLQALQRKWCNHHLRSTTCPTLCCLTPALTFFFAKGKYLSLNGCGE